MTGVFHSRRGFMAMLAGLSATTFGGRVAPLGAEVRHRYFRIGTGAVGAASFPVGSLLATIVSSPPGSRPCDRGGSCGVPGLIAVAQSTDGSVQNVRDVAAGRLDSGLIHGDVAYWAYRGAPPFARDGAVDSLRLIANLFVESVHLVVAAGSDVTTVRGLRRKRVSLGRTGTALNRNVRAILAAHGVRPAELRAVALSTADAAAALSAGKLDGFFHVGVAPSDEIARLVEAGAASLVPVSGAPLEALRGAAPYFAVDTLPARTYPGAGTVPTVGVPVQWLVRDDADAGLVHGITEALWHPNAARLLAAGSAVSRRITLDAALTTTSVPLHPGAERFYRDKGLVNGAPVLP